MEIHTLSHQYESRQAESRLQPQVIFRGVFSMKFASA